MLDTETKRRIDTARDILVGKVPDPKSQVEQITIALIYKFMDDMDLESEELGGERKFFAGEFARFGWAKLMHGGLGGFETLNLYAEAISVMPQNPGIPALFRDIFKNAYLPYRDPETLRAFLKVIDEFVYDHSERLGDAFEYLLSVLGSQGDAGQFRTPRHIIDFMVAIVDPRKDERVLDPACGTAGFLVSSYKHILKANADAEGQSRLTPDERAQLAANFTGYDISPDMVRLSLVNLYLHGFKEPHIYEYDTLTSLERWGEHADVILANPPFMSPKGGIIPHNRFGVQSKRSEVLFVDYMAEHLRPDGRAGIIVPEGIIFQSAGAYTQLRRMLVEDYLVAVISLPAGVFNPYSGVKTSILILDKALAKKAEGIAFFKVENDGYGLGAQRRPVEGGQLEAVAAEAAEYLRRLRAGEGLEGYAPVHGLVVGKAKIAAGGEYNLSVERYRENGERSLVFPIIALKEVAQIDWGNTKLTKEAYVDGGKYLAVSAAGGDGRIDHAEHKSGTLVLSAIGANCGRMFYPTEDFTAIKNTITLTTDTTIILPYFLFLVLSNSTFPKRGGGQPFISKGDVQSFEIPLPPLEVQREIVAEVEGYQKVIDGARMVLAHYRPHITVDPAWPLVALGEAPVELIDGDRGENYPKKEEFFSSGDCLFLNTKNVRPDGFCFDNLEYITSERDQLLRKGKLRRGDVVLTTRGTVGNTGLYDQSVKFDHVRINSGMLIFRPLLEHLLSEYLFLYFQSENFIAQREAIISGSAQPQLPIRDLIHIKMPLPDIGHQRIIVDEILQENSLVAANRELVTRMEGKIQAAMARVWGEG
jgi:type I restriction enzyme M protein